MVPNEATQPPDREQAAKALQMWRGGLRLYEVLEPRRRMRYALAIGAAQQHLQRYNTMAELVRAYLASVETPGSNEWLERACDLSCDGIRLSREIVEDVAYWRRLRQLVAVAAAAEQG